MPTRLLLLSLTCLALGPACAPLHPRDATLEELRALVAARLPQVRAAELVRPHQVSPAAQARARELTALARTRLERAQALRDALFAPAGFGLRYAEGLTATAEETLAAGQGNCLSLAAVYVGLARGLALEATFLDASASLEQTHAAGPVLVRTGHVTAAVETETGLLALEFGQRLGARVTFRAMDDLEATAHFYNNRGYELMRQARGQADQAVWEQIARQFRLATLVRPDFARAWNNLGVALLRLGRPDEALASYRVAAALEPRFPSPRINLGIQLLHAGEPEEALRALDEVQRLEPANPRVWLLRAEALARLQRLAEAAALLGQVLEARPGHPRARALLGGVCERAGGSPPACRLAAGSPGSSQPSPQ
ncbi:MAG TPA: tetratricopeptide repeat protein [Myxococcota bacterium]|nr:tetratricopeptide repeat protein [Myxococcota bacterium]HRY95389.1 tetratricopeptide repeat protein [Myxococcota bacterium]HSA24564.1 tetratricopeptide repeat protein [Myxococcota bacterium]